MRSRLAAVAGHPATWLRRDWRTPCLGERPRPAMTHRIRPAIIWLVGAVAVAWMHLPTAAHGAEGETRLLELVATLSTWQPPGRWIEAMERLYERPDERTVDLLRGFALSDAHGDEVRIHALRGLSRLDGYPSYLAISQVASGESPAATEVREAAQHALGHHPESMRVRPREAAVGDATVVALLIQATTADPSARAGAVSALAASGRADVLPVVVEVARTAPAVVAEAAIDALARRDDGASAESLRSVWRDDAAPPSTRTRALDALRARPDPAATDAAFEELEALGDQADPQALSDARAAWAARHPGRAAARATVLGRPDPAAADDDVLIEAMLMSRAAAPWQRLRAAGWVAAGADPVLVPVQADMARRGSTIAARMRGIRALAASASPEARAALDRLAAGDATSDPVAYEARRALAAAAPVAPSLAPSVAPPPPQPAPPAAPDPPAEPLPPPPVLAQDVPEAAPEEPPDPRAGIGLLAGSSAILGSIWLESLGDAAQQDRQSWERWVAVSSGALLGGGSALLVTLRSDVSAAEAGWFASMGGMASAAGWMLPTGLGLATHGPEFNFTLLGLQTAGIVGGALTLDDHGLDTGGLLFMDGSALVGAATGLGVALQFPSGDRPHRAFLPVTGGMLLGAAGGYFGGRGSDLTGAERGVVTFSVLNGAAAGVLAASAFHSQQGLEAEENRQLLGGALIGGGVGYGVGIIAGQLGDPDGDDLVHTATGEGLGLMFGLGAGLLTPGLEARRVRGTALFGAGAGALGGILLGPHVDMGADDAPLLLLGSATGVTNALFLGAALGPGADRALAGGLLAGGSAGLVAAGALAHRGLRRTSSEAGVDLLGAGVGALGGQGISLLSEPGDWGRFALRAGGYGSYLLLTDRLELGDDDAPVVLLGGVEGLATGLLLHRALDAQSAAGAAMTGAAVGLAAGGLASEVWKPSAGRATAVGLAAGVGMMGGLGWRLLDEEQDGAEASWIALGGLWGLTTLYSQLDIDGDDAPLLTLGGPLAMTTGWLMAEATGIRDDERQSGAALLGLTTAAAVLGPASEVVTLTPGQAWQAAAGAGIGLLGGWGLEDESDLAQGDGAALQIATMWGSAALWSQYDLDAGAAPLLALGTLAGGSTELLGARSAGVRDGERLLGSTVAGAAWGSTAAGALSHWWRPTPTEATTFGVSGVMGLLAGDGMARLIADTDGDDVALGQLVGLWGGLGVGRLIQPVPHTFMVSLFTGTVGGATGLLTTQASGVREERRETGGLSFGLWSGALAGAVAAPYVGYDRARGVRLTTGGIAGFVAGSGFADHFAGAGPRSSAAGRLGGMWAGLAAGAASSATSVDLPWITVTTLAGAATEGFVNAGLGQSRPPALGIGGGALAGMLTGGVRSRQGHRRLSLGVEQSVAAGLYGGVGVVAGASWAALHADDHREATPASMALGGMWTGLVVGASATPSAGDRGFVAASSLWTALAVEHLERSLGNDELAASLLAGAASGMMASSLLAAAIDAPGGGRTLLATSAGAVGSVGGLGASWLLGRSRVEQEGGAQLAGLLAGTAVGGVSELEPQDGWLVALGALVGSRTGHNLGVVADDLTAEQGDGASLLGGSVGALSAAAVARRWNPSGGQLGGAAVAGLLGLTGSLGSRQLFADGDPGRLALGEIAATWGGLTLGALVEPTAADAPLFVLSAGASAGSVVLLTRATGVTEDRRQGGAMLMGLSAGALGGWALSDRYEPSTSSALLTGSGGLAGWLLADGTGRLLYPDRDQSHAGAGLAGMWGGLLGAGLALQPWQVSDTGKLAMGLLTVGGGLHGLGWGSVLGVDGERLRGGVELGAVAGLLGGAWVSRDPEMAGRRVLEVAGGNALGALLGGLSVGVFLPELEGEGALAASLATSYAGTAVGLLRPNQPSALAMAAAGGTLGFVAGHGGVRLLSDLDQAGGTAVATAGLTGGLLAGGLLVEPWELTAGDAVVMAAATGYGGLQGFGWAEVADVSDRRRRGAAEVGAAVGVAGGTWLARAYDLDRSTVVLTLGSATALMSVASGLSLLTEETPARKPPADDRDYDHAIGAGLGLSAVGLAGGALLSRQLELDGGELATTTVGAVWGVAQGSTWAAATGAGERKGAGAVLLGTGLGGVAGAILAENVKINLYRSLVLGSGAVWGGWLGLGGTYASGVPWQQSVVGGLAVANAGILTGLALASRTQSLAQVGWVNLFGLAGTGVGTAVGVAASQAPRARVISMVGGSLIGLVGGIAGTAYSDWWRAPGDAAPRSAAGENQVRTHTSSGLVRMLKTTEDDAIVIPGLTWIPPKDAQGEPAPVLQVTVLH